MAGMHLTRAGWPSKVVLIVLAGIVVSTMLLAALWTWSGQRRSTAAAEIGRQVYVQHCAACHGVQLEGQAQWQTRKPDGRMPAPPHDATGHTWHHTNEQLFGIVKHGIEAFAPPGYKSDMPAYKDVLSDDDILAVLAYIEGTWPESIRQRREQMMSGTR